MNSRRTWQIYKFFIFSLFRWEDGNKVIKDWRMTTNDCYEDYVSLLNRSEGSHVLISFFSSALRRRNRHEYIVKIRARARINGRRILDRVSSRANAFSIPIPWRSSFTIRSEHGFCYSGSDRGGFIEVKERDRERGSVCVCVCFLLVEQQLCGILPNNARLERRFVERDSRCRDIYIYISLLSFVESSRINTWRNCLVWKSLKGCTLYKTYNFSVRPKP